MPSINNSQNAESGPLSSASLSSAPLSECDEFLTELSADQEALLAGASSMPAPVPLPVPEPPKRKLPTRFFPIFRRRPGFIIIVGRGRRFGLL